MKKRIVAAMLALCLVFAASFCVTASAEDAKLKFDKNGEFKILHLCDCQDVYPADTRMMKFIDTVLKLYEPDLVVLGGDNSVGPHDMTREMKENAIEELTNAFVENKTYFTLVFGNHDREQGFDNDTLLELYQEYGGEYCLAYDEIPELHGSATHNLPVYSSNGSEMKFNVWMFDSGSNVYDETGENRLGYDCVTEDQINWYKEKSKTLVDGNGKMVNSLAFQHIIVGDVYDALFVETSTEMGELSRSFNGKTYSFLPRTDNFTGFLLEFPCPGYYNYGQFDAMVETGNVLGIFSGHDHINTFETELKGIKIINTPGATYHSYGRGITRGCRLITVNEKDTSTFTSEVITINGLAAKNADFAKDAGFNRIISFVTVLSGDFLLACGKLSGIFAKIFY